jgi:hypothetical protein
MSTLFQLTSLILPALLATAPSYINPRVPLIEKSDLMSQQKMQLSTSVVRKEYCDRDHLRLKLRFRFANVGSEKLILFKYSLAVTRYMVSRTANDATNRRYVKEVKPFVELRISKSPLASTPSEELFAILKPGDSYEINDDFHLSVSDGTRDTSDFLGPGNYLLQIRVPTWWWGDDNYNSMRERWREFGYLFSDDLTSEPMPIHIAKAPAVLKCENH